MHSNWLEDFRVKQDAYFIYFLYKGMKPRFFAHDDPEDCIVAEENTAIDEVIFIQTGIIAVGFSKLASFRGEKGPYEFAYR